MKSNKYAFERNIVGQTEIDDNYRDNMNLICNLPFQLFLNYSVLSHPLVGDINLQHIGTNITNNNYTNVSMGVATKLDETGGTVHGGLLKFVNLWVVKIEFEHFENVGPFMSEAFNEMMMRFHPAYPSEDIVKTEYGYDFNWFYYDFYGTEGPPIRQPFYNALLSTSLITIHRMSVL
jgi:hypothetical protein